MSDTPVDVKRGAVLAFEAYFTGDVSVEFTDKIDDNIRNAEVL